MKKSFIVAIAVAAGLDCRFRLVGSASSPCRRPRSRRQRGDEYRHVADGATGKLKTDATQTKTPSWTSTRPNRASVRSRETSKEIKGRQRGVGQSAGQITFGSNLSISRAHHPLDGYIGPKFCAPNLSYFRGYAIRNREHLIACANGVFGNARLPVPILPSCPDPTPTPIQGRHLPVNHARRPDNPLPRWPLSTTKDHLCPAG